MANYKVVSIDLSQVTTKPVLFWPINSPVYGIYVLQYPAGSSVNLRFGGSANDPVPILNQGVLFDYGEKPETNGIYFEVPSVQTGTVILYMDQDGPCPSTGVGV